MNFAQMVLDTSIKPARDERTLDGAPVSQDRAIPVN
jgi:hypothetical protein